MRGSVGEGACNSLERRQGITNRKHHFIQDQIKKWVYYIRRCYIWRYNRRLIWEGWGLGGFGGKRVDGAGMQFVKDAKATQHKLEA